MQDGRNLTDENKSMTNTYIAKYSHSRRRASQQASALESQCIHDGSDLITKDEQLSDLELSKLRSDQAAYIRYRDKPPRLTRNYLHGIASDPFTSTACPIDVEALDLLDHCRRFHVFAAWPRLAGAIGLVGADWTVHLGDAMSESPYLQALFASGAFARAQARNFESLTLCAYLESKQTAFAALRQSIDAGRVGKLTVLAIMQMVALEHQAGSFMQAVSLQRGAKIVLELLGSEVQWKPHEMAFITDIWLSVDEMESGCIATDNFDPGPWFRQGLGAHGQTDGLHEQTQLTTVNYSDEHEDKLEELFAAIRELTIIYDWMHVTKSPKEKSKAALWLQMRATAIKRRLMDYRIRVRAMSQQQTRPLSGNLALALCNSAVCYVCFAFVGADFIGVAPAGPQSASRQIVECVLRESDHVDEEERKDAALLWILFVQILQQQYNRHDLVNDPEAGSFRYRFAELLNRLRCTSWLQAKIILQQFLYRPQLMDDALKVLYDEGEAQA